MSEYLRAGQTHNLTHIANGTRAKTEDETQEEMDHPADISITNVNRYLTAEASLHLNGPVTDEVFEDRATKCKSCPLLRHSTTLPDEIGYCSGCGCGVNSRSKLTVKLRMPASTCPLNKWAKSEGRHASVIDRLKSWVVKKILK